MKNLAAAFLKDAARAGPAATYEWVERWCAANRISEAELQDELMAYEYEQRQYGQAENEDAVLHHWKGAE